jgi:hypothetical protein
MAGYLGGHIAPAALGAHARFATARFSSADGKRAPPRPRRAVGRYRQPMRGSICDAGGARSLARKRGASAGKRLQSLDMGYAPTESRGRGISPLIKSKTNLLTID